MVPTPLPVRSLKELVEFSKTDKLSYASNGSGTIGHLGMETLLAATSLQRSGFAPEVPTIAELGYPGYEVDVWFALYAPARTPGEIISRLGAETRKYTAPSTPKQVRAKIVSEQKVNPVAVTVANVKPE